MRLATGLAVAIVLVAGCGGLANPETAPSSQPSQTAGGPASPKPKQRSIITWLVELGPGTPPGPATGPRLDIYLAVQKKTCLPELANTRGRKAELKRTSYDLYVGVVAACLAAFRNGGAEEWATAEEGLKAPKDGTCLDKPIRDLLQRLVDAHRKNPTWQFTAQVPTGASGRRPSCPAITRIDPAKGPIVNAKITVTGTNLSDALIVFYVGKEYLGFTGPDTEWGSPSERYEDEIKARSDTSIQFAASEFGISFDPPLNIRIGVAVRVSDSGTDQDLEVIDSRPFTINAGA